MAVNQIPSLFFRRWAERQTTKRLIEALENSRPLLTAARLKNTTVGRFAPMHTYRHLNETYWELLHRVEKVPERSQLSEVEQSKIQQLLGMFRESL